MFLSVIIPVYKVEDYLRTCVDSVLGQKLTDYEIILVDDGSPDGCPAICDEYAAKYDCIRVIHKENGGSSSARNEGMKAAHGRYIMFMDSDDWWNPQVSVNAMLDYVKSHPRTQLFQFGTLEYLEGIGYQVRNEHAHMDSISTDSAVSYYRDLFRSGNLEVHAATKIIARSFLEENDLFFTSGITAEDNEWLIRLYRVLDEVEVIPELLYVYRAQRAGSITSTMGPKNIRDLLNTVDKSLQFWGDKKAPEELKECELCFCSYLWFCALGLSRKLDKAEFLGLLPQFKKTASVCRYSRSRKTKLAYTAYQCLGLRASRYLLGLYIRLKGTPLIKDRKIVENEGFDRIG